MSDFRGKAGADERAARWEHSRPREDVDPTSLPTPHAAAAHGHHIDARNFCHTFSVRNSHVNIIIGSSAHVSTPSDTPRARRGASSWRERARAAAARTASQPSPDFDASSYESSSVSTRAPASGGSLSGHEGVQLGMGRRKSSTDGSFDSRDDSDDDGAMPATDPPMAAGAGAGAGTGGGGGRTPAADRTRKSLVQAIFRRKHARLG